MSPVRGGKYAAGRWLQQQAQAEWGDRRPLGALQGFCFTLPAQSSLFPASLWEEDFLGFFSVSR